ncbi:cytochrome cbb3 oxidase maturation protein CcoH [Brucella vulpis]|uniref:FixH family protein n=1 Tax=Brucella vulpis TaxID=981386 RepID=UPI00073ACFB9|nr:cytochrome cbb3 oxidase maturation protein CcoH [Brucella vulpis]CUW49155.1 cytochrome cbb3 oxidase maturation protein CcoH [Brucella vulpis]
MSTNSKTSGTFTGWHMLGIMFMFFGVIIAVNLLMAYNAVHSWSGLVVQNSYVASQEFNNKAKTGKEQAALNWQSTPAYENGVFTWQLADHDGKAVAMMGGTVDFKRPVGDAHDTKVTLTVRESGILTAPLELGEGAWIMEVNADAGLEDPYRHIIRVLVKDGKIL